MRGWPDDRIAFGGDYNPEQWPRAVWDDDMRLMRESGVSFVTLGVFSWSWLEPSKGEYTFEWLDEIMDLLHANGIAVDLATATATPPPWLTSAYPRSCRSTATGTPCGRAAGSRGARPPPSTATSRSRSPTASPPATPTTRPWPCGTSPTSTPATTCPATATPAPSPSATGCSAATTPSTRSTTPGARRSGASATRPTTTSSRRGAPRRSTTPPTCSTTTGSAPTPCSTSTGPSTR